MPRPSGPDTADRLEPAAADQVHQDGLGLVVERVTFGDRLCPDRAADVVSGVRARHGRPRLDGDPLARSIVGRPEVGWHAQPLREPSDVRALPRRVGPEPMIEVEDLEPDPEQPAEVPQGIEQAHRIRATGDADQHHIPRPEHLVLAGRPRHPFEHAGDGRRAAHQPFATLPTHRAGSAISSGLGRLASSRQTRLNPSIPAPVMTDRKSTRLNSSHGSIPYAVFCVKKRKYNVDIFTFYVHNRHVYVEQWFKLIG